MQRPSTFSEVQNNNDRKEPNNQLTDTFIGARRKSSTIPRTKKSRRSITDSCKLPAPGAKSSTIVWARLAERLFSLPFICQHSMASLRIVCALPPPSRGAESLVWNREQQNTYDKIARLIDVSLSASLNHSEDVLRICSGTTWK